MGHKNKKWINRYRSNSLHKLYRRVNVEHFKFRLSKYKHHKNMRYRFPFYYSFSYFLNKITNLNLYFFSHVYFFYFKSRFFYIFLRLFFLYFFLISSYMKRVHFKKNRFFFSHFFFFFSFFSTFFFTPQNMYINSFSSMQYQYSFFFFSKYSSIFFFRHFFFSFFYWSIYFYSYYKYILSNSNTFLFFSFSEIESSYIGVNSFINIFKQNTLFVSFLFKFFYLSILHSFFFRFGTSDLLSDTFFFFLFRFFDNRFYFSYISSLISVSYIRNSFFSFLSGRYSSRFFFFFFRFNFKIHIYFFFWLLKRYHYLYFSLSFRKLKDDFFFFFLISYSLSSHNNFFSLFLRFSSLYFGKKTFFNSYSNMISHSFNIVSFFFFSYKVLFISSLLSISFFSFILHCESFKWHFLFYRKCLLHFTYQLESSLFSYSKVPHFFFFNFYDNTNFFRDKDKYSYSFRSSIGYGYFNNLVPPITNAKILCDYIVIMLSLGLKIKQVFSSILAWQTYWQHIYDRRTFRFITKYGVNLGEFLYPLKGIRIVCSGPAYKARRTTSLKYHLWVSDEFFTGRMPLSTMDLAIDYYQSVSVIRRSNIGVKVWLLFDNVI